MRSQLSADELAYHRDVTRQVRNARAVMESWSMHLAVKYKLQRSDSVDEDGRIHRGDCAKD